MISMIIRKKEGFSQLERNKVIGIADQRRKRGLAGWERATTNRSNGPSLGFSLFWLVFASLIEIFHGKCKTSSDVWPKGSFEQKIFLSLELRVFYTIWEREPGIVIRSMRNDLNASINPPTKTLGQNAKVTSFKGQTGRSEQTRRWWWSGEGRRTTNYGPTKFWISAVRVWPVFSKSQLSYCLLRFFLLYLIVVFTYLKFTSQKKLTKPSTRWKNTDLLVRSRVIPRPYS